MYNGILVIVGILLMVISIGVCFKIIIVNPVKELRWQWYVMICLILFFLFAYIAYLFFNSNFQYIQLNSYLISSLLFFGSVFVISVLLISYKMIKKLTDKDVENIETNKKLTTNKESLEQKQKELEKTQKMLEKRNIELEQTLDDFYTLRIGLQKDLEAGKVEEENKKLKQKLEELKRN